VDQQDLVLGGFLLGHLQTLLYCPSVLDFRTSLFVDFVYYVYPCSVETSRGSILLLWSFYTLFTLCPFKTKNGEYMLVLDRECVFNPIKYFLSQNGQRGSLFVFVLAAFCCTKSLLCNVAAFTGMPYILESSDIQSLFL
jgi:hypothetical protein